jgi:hypothetical protein
MGLWLKCPKCQVANPLDLKSCQSCNASLENLPAAERVYVLGKASVPAAPAAAKAAVPMVVAEESPKETTASAEPPPKPAKKARARKKKQ